MTYSINWKCFRFFCRSENNWIITLMNMRNISRKFSANSSFSFIPIFGFSKQSWILMRLRLLFHYQTRNKLMYFSNMNLGYKNQNIRLKLHLFKKATAFGHVFITGIYSIISIEFNYASYKFMLDLFWYSHQII